MPKLKVNNQTAEVAEDKRLVLAIEEQGIDIGHRCGGFARCTTCRVEFEQGEPQTFTRAEFSKLHEAGLYGRYRLSCQIVCDHEMSVRPAMTLQSEGWTDTGPPPQEQVTPEAAWYPREQLESEEQSREQGS
jgi:ferredoxin